MKIMIINGPNLNLLGLREPDIYGRNTFEDLKNMCLKKATELEIEVDIRQSNHEGDLVDYIQETMNGYDGIVINPAAYTHTSVAILDAVKSVNKPCIEVHISDVSKREDFRQVSYIRLACLKTIQGEGFMGYLHALEDMKDYLLKEGK